MSGVNIVKKIKIDGDWKLLSIPRHAKGNRDWNADRDRTTAVAAGSKASTEESAARRYGTIAKHEKSMGLPP